MKKGIIVLLIAVLAAGFAFASFSGSASIGFDFDLSSKENGLFNDQAMKYSFTFDLEHAVGESKGEGDLYAEISATADFIIKADAVKASGAVNPTVALKIKKANIVYKDVTINILGPTGAYDYAKSYWTNAKGQAIRDYANNYKPGAPGFVASYKDFSLAFAYRTDDVAEQTVDPVYGLDTTSGAIKVTNAAAVKAGTVYTRTTNLYAGLQTPAFELADGLTLQVAGNFKMTKVEDNDADLRAGGGAKIAYKNDDLKLNVTFAADAEYNNEKLPVDLSLSAKYDFVTANVYFGTSDKFAEDTSTLGAKLSASYTFDEKITVGGYAETREVFLQEHPWLSFGANLGYDAEKFSAYAKAVVSMKYSTADEAYKFNGNKDTNGAEYAGLGFACGVSTDAIISNCTLALDWTDSDFSVKTADDKLAQLGVIAVSATVEF
jgi:hypothetical protein